MDCKTRSETLHELMEDLLITETRADENEELTLNDEEDDL